MEETIESYLKKGHQYMEESIQHLERELLKVRTGKASGAMLEGILVDYYGTQTPINQLANITSIDARSLNIQPWDKGALNNIERAIFEANLGITPQNDGENIRLNIPPLTEERRKDLVKQCKALGEEAKVSIRSARHKMMDFIKKEVKEGYPEDAGKRKEEEVDKMVTGFNNKVDQYIKAKEEDILTI